MTSFTSKALMQKCFGASQGTVYGLMLLFLESVKDSSKWNEFVSACPACTSTRKLADKCAEAFASEFSIVHRVALLSFQGLIVAQAEELDVAAWITNVSARRAGESDSDFRQRIPCTAFPSVGDGHMNESFAYSAEYQWTDKDGTVYTLPVKEPPPRDEEAMKLIKELKERGGW